MAECVPITGKLPLCAAAIVLLLTGPSSADSPSMVRVGVAQNPPIAFHGQNGKPTGLAIDVINDIAAQENWRVTFIQAPWPNLLKKLDAGEIDILSGIAYSEKRAHRYDFTSETMVSNWGIVYRRPDVPINSALDLEGKRLAFTGRGIHSLAIVDLLKKFSVTYVPVVTKSYGEALGLIDKGEAEAAVVSRLFGIMQAHKYGVVSTAINFNPVEVRFATPKGKGAVLRAAIDRYLSAAKNDPGSSYHEYLNRWITIPIQKEVPQWLIWSSGGALAGLCATLVIIWLLRRRVAARTKELRGSEEKFRVAAQAANDAIISSDVNGTIIYWNKAARRIFGYAGDEIIGKPITTLIPESQRSRHENGFKRAIETDQLRTGGLPTELTALAKDGCELSVELSASKWEAGGQRFFTAIIRDITERKRAEEKLRESEEMHAQAQEIAHLGHWSWNVATNNVSWSDESCRIFGRKPEELGDTYEGFIACVHPEDRERVMANVEASISTGKPYKCEYRIIFPNGSEERYIDAQGVAALDLETGEPLNLMGTVLDITESKWAEETLLRAKEEAEYANCAKTKFLANISHELRTPLNGIIGFSEMMLSETFGPLADKYKGYAADINMSGQHLLAVIMDILDISKLDKGLLDLDETEINLYRLTVPCMKLTQKKADEGEVTLSLEMSEDIPHLLADETRVKQILLNLLSNAVKFTPAEGKVSVDARTEDDGSISLQVKDTGRGIEAENISKVLEPFVQTEDIMTRSHEGSGLGLPLSKRLMEMHDGTLDIESEVGVGTSVTVSFPPERTVAS